MSYCYEHGISHSEFLSWNVDDRSKTLAFMMEKSLRCELCGTAEWEWEADRHAYEPVEKFCMGCYFKHVADEGSGNTPGTMIVMEPSKSVATAKRHTKMKREASRGR